MFEQGVQGSTPDEAFYVKCDDENNPVEARGRAAPGRYRRRARRPEEFITIRPVHAEGITVA